MTEPVKKVKFLTNKDLLEEIHKSKTSYCEFVDKKYSKYDFIVNDLSKATIERIEQARQKKVTDTISQIRKEHSARGIKNFKPEVSIDEFPVDTIVIRLMTFDHIPINEEKVHKAKTEGERHIRCNFPPFQHYIFKDGEFVLVGQSHYKAGEFSLTHGKMTNKLALMFMMMVERYGHRGNWRGYCVDEETQALTKRGWLNIDEINETDQVLSHQEGSMKWSKILSIYRDEEYDGLMHRMTLQGMDAFVTPNHKMLTDRGLIPIELLKEQDHVILMGDRVQDDHIAKHPDSLVELAGWIVTDGCYDIRSSDQFLRRICIYQNNGPKADRIRDCLNQLDIKFSESVEKNICFAINRSDSHKLAEILPNKNLTMEFILDLTADQRELLINTMIDGDGWRTNGHRRYAQKDLQHVDLFQALCAISGHRAISHAVTNHTSFGKLTNYHTINIFSKRKNTTKVACVDFHGGKRNGRDKILGKGKENHPNEPTVNYKGRVWCPETEYGSFLVRRNGTVYLTGNSYLDEMKCQALLQLSQVGLQFDESRSDIPNPFAYLTQVTKASFIRALNLEKRNQDIRDDLLIMAGAMPSYTKQTEHEIEQQKINAEISAAKKDAASE